MRAEPIPEIRREKQNEKASVIRYPCRHHANGNSMRVRWILCVEGKPGTHINPCNIVSPQSNRNPQTHSNTQVYTCANLQSYSNPHKKNLYIPQS